MLACPAPELRCKVGYRPRKEPFEKRPTPCTGKSAPTRRFPPFRRAASAGVRDGYGDGQVGRPPVPPRPLFACKVKFSCFCPRIRGHLLRLSGRPRHGRPHEPAQLRARALTHGPVAHGDAQGVRPRGGRRAHGCARDQGSGLREAQPESGRYEPRQGERGLSFTAVRTNLRAGAGG